MKLDVLPLVGLVLIGIACGAPHAVSTSPTLHYVVTASPIDVSVGSLLCVAVAPSDPAGVWWWEPGPSGCSTRSTGPDVFRAEGASVRLRPGTADIDVAFGIPLIRAPGSLLPSVREVHLLLVDNGIVISTSGARVASVVRKDLQIAEELPTVNDRRRSPR